MRVDLGGVMQAARAQLDMLECFALARSVPSSSTPLAI